jgi:hypothetical protein
MKHLKRFKIFESIGEVIGKGRNGIAYLLDDGKVLKETNCIIEFIKAKKILNSNKNLESLPKIYNVEKKNDKYYITKDYYSEIDSDLKNKLKDKKIIRELENFIENESNEEELIEQLGNKFLDFIKNIKKDLIDLGLKSNIDAEYLHENIGIDTNNKKFILFDF